MTSNPQPVIIKPYDPHWVDLCEIESRLILNTIGSHILRIEHVGSTSVPGLAAKPIIDILIGVKQISDSPSFIPPLVNLGYIYQPEHEIELPERRYLKKVENGEHKVHLHIVETTTPFFKRHIAFRDYLREHSEIAAEYTALKYKLAAQYGSDREGYTDAKTEFIQSVEKLALG